MGIEVRSRKGTLWVIVFLEFIYVNASESRTLRARFPKPSGLLYWSGIGNPYAGFSGLNVRPPRELTDLALPYLLSPAPEEIC